MLSDKIREEIEFLKNTINEIKKETQSLVVSEIKDRLAGSEENQETINDLNEAFEDILKRLESLEVQRDQERRVVVALQSSSKRLEDKTRRLRARLDKLKYSTVSSRLKHLLGIIYPRKEKIEQKTKSNSYNEPQEFNEMGANSNIPSIQNIERSILRQVEKYQRLKLNPRTEEEKLHRNSIQLVEEIDEIKFDHLVSIIMPCWNREKVINRAIESVLCQTYQYFELVISDDGSDDGTIKMIEEKYSSEIGVGKIVVIQGERGGVSKARNRGLEVARGDYIAYLDSDNSWDEDFLKIMIGSLELSRRKCAYTGIVIFNSSAKSHKILLQEDFDRQMLESANYIDLNAFVHKKEQYTSLGGFDEGLNRLVDWDLILKYTLLDAPQIVKAILVNYHLQDNIDHISRNEDLYSNYNRIREKEYVSRQLYSQRKFVKKAKEDLFLGYVLWEFPVLSETFIINELRWLVENDYKIKVYYKNSPQVSVKLDFEIDSIQVEDDIDLVIEAKRDGVNLFHSHWVYPTTTLLTELVCERLEIPFTFTGQGVDIFHKKNIVRGRIEEIANGSNCQAVFAIGKFHRLFFLKQGTPEAKICMVPMSVDVSTFSVDKVAMNKSQRKVCCISRFVEKKGIIYLIKAAKFLPDIRFDIFGFGQEEELYKELIKKEKISNVEIKDTLKTRSEVIEALTGHDLFVMPCVRAESGDMDGLPVVFIESMALGIPVISSNISSIGDIVIDGYSGFLTKEKDISSIVNAIDRFYSLRDEEMQQMSENCIRLVGENYNTVTTMKKIERIWLGVAVDIILVSYENLNELKEVVRRIYKYTLTPFHLTIIDNNSGDSVKDYLNYLSKEAQNITVELLKKNIFCGPASNRALEKTTGEYVIYLCSKEAFILDYDWEETMIRYLDQNPKVGIAGHLSYSPSYYHAVDLERHPLFKKFRNQHFTKEQSIFRHVQGGLYILRRKMYDEIGGFSDDTPQEMMDVEYSFYVESCGWKLGSIDNIYSLTVKTRPTIDALIDENTKAAHPLTLDKLGHYANMKFKDVSNCNICTWEGQSFDVSEDQQICPSCQSNRFQRTLYKYLAETDLTFRKLKILEINPTSNGSYLKKPFVYKSIQLTEVNLKKELKDDFDILILNEIDAMTNEYLEYFIKSLSDSSFAVLESYPDEILRKGILLEKRHFFSKVNGYLNKPFYLLRRAKSKI